MAAVVIYGTVRDYEDVVKLGVPVYALGTSPGGPLKGWGGNINYPVACAGVVVNPGDVVLGNDDGVVVIPRDLVKILPAYCERRLAKEKSWVEAAMAGESTLDILGLRTKLEQLGILFD